MLLDLMQGIYMDCEPNRTVQMINPILMRTKVSNRFELTENESLQTRGIFDSFPALRPTGKYKDVKADILQVLKCSGNMNSSDFDKNMWCRSIVSALCFLLQCGLYTHVFDDNGAPTVAYPQGAFDGYPTTSSEIMPPSMCAELHELLDVTVELLSTAGTASSHMLQFCHKAGTDSFVVNGR